MMSDFQANNSDHNMIDSQVGFTPLLGTASGDVPPQHAGFFDNLCPNLSAKMRQFASTNTGFWTLVILSPLLLVLGFAALIYIALFLSGLMITDQAIWYLPKLNEVREEYESSGVPVTAKVTKHCRAKGEKGGNTYNVTAVYKAPQDSCLYAKTFKYTVTSSSGLGINIGSVRLGFSQGPAFPTEMDFLVLPSYPASGQLREQAIKKDSDFQRAIRILLGPIVYFVFAYYIPKDLLSQTSSCGPCQDAALFNVVSVFFLVLNLMLTWVLVPAFHAENMKNMYEGARPADLEDMDVEMQHGQARSSVNTSVNVSRCGLSLSTKNDQQQTQRFALSFR